MYQYAYTVMKSYSYKMSYHKFILFHDKIKFPCQYIPCAYALFRNIWKTFSWKYVKKHYEPHRICLTTEENQSQAVRKQFFILWEVVASKAWFYIQTTITCKIDIMWFAA